MADLNYPSDYSPSDILWYPEDLTGTKNYITDEDHVITTIGSNENRIIITPYYGAFYYDNFAIDATDRIPVNDTSTNNTNGTTATETAQSLKVTLIKYESPENVTTGSLGRELVPVSDYEVGGLDIGRTKISSSKYGVYQYIVLSESIVSTLSTRDIIRISYHAFGGNSNYRELIRCFNYLKANDVLNKLTTLNNTDIAGLLERITDLENRVAALENS